VLAPGTAAPELSLPDLYGRQWSLHDALPQGPVVLAFFKVSCPTCQLTFPFLQRLIDDPHDAPGKGPQLVAISQDEAPDTHEFQQRFGVSMPTLIDARPDYPASNGFLITSVPSIFVVESDGTISLAVDGFNKAAIEQIGRMYGLTPFLETDHVPALRPG
jgi:peroxiredoxin